MQRRDVIFFGSIAALLALAAGAELLAHRSGPPPEPPEQHAARLSREHGLIVKFGAPSSFYIPPYGPRDAPLVGAEIEAAAPENASPALDGIEESLAQYPAGFVASVVKGIFITGRLRLQGADAGGTYGPAWLLLVAAPFMNPPTIRWNNRHALHHELSSLVFLRNPENYSRWTAFSPVGWQFADDAKSSLARASNPLPLLSTGFLSAYGGTTPENDFNVYAEKMFTEPRDVAYLAREYPLIARKVAFVAATYAAIDPRLTHTFRSLGLWEFVSLSTDAGAADSDSAAGAPPLSP